MDETSLASPRWNPFSWLWPFHGHHTGTTKTTTTTTSAFRKPNDPYSSDQEFLEALGATQAWRHVAGFDASALQRATVDIIDSGLRYPVHQDLIDSLWSN